MENRQRTVLVVEDDHDLRALTLELLAAEGFTVAGARHGREAVSLIMGGLRPDVVLLDLCMPVMNGPELLAWLRAERTTSAIPVLVLSCKDARRDALPLHEEVQGWILKPPSSSELLNAIDRLCKRDVATRRRPSGSGWSAFRAAV